MANETIRVYVNGSPTPAATGTADLEGDALIGVSGLTQGSHTITVTSQAGAGPESAPIATSPGTANVGASLGALIVPADRRTIWNPGLYGGIPADDAIAANRMDGAGPATVFATLAPGDNIQAALDAAGAVATKASRRIVQLQSGTFNVTSLSLPSYVILRGTLGANNARLTAINRTAPTGQDMITAGQGSAWGTPRNLVGVHNKGATTITVDNATDFAVGDIITIDQTADGTMYGPSDGIEQYNVPSTGNWLWWKSSQWYSRQSYANDSSAPGRYPDSATWRMIDQLSEVVAKNGNTLTIYDPNTKRGAPLHLTFYNQAQVYKSSGASTNCAQFVGLEDLKVWDIGVGGQRTISYDLAAFCWIKNVETDGSHNVWAGRHIELYSQTYRCEIRQCYCHESSNYNQGGNAYGIDIQGSCCLIEDNVSVKHNKPIVMENSGGGNVVSYNYVDWAYGNGSPTDGWQEAAISTHASFCHSDLYEGNFTPNIGCDSTHGNNGWNLIFRNWCTGRNTNLGASYCRGVFVDGWQRELTSIGNVLWSPTDVPDYLMLYPALGINPTYNGPTMCYMLGANSWIIGQDSNSSSDRWDNGQSYSHFYRHLDWTPNEGVYLNPTNPITTLPDSAYLTGKPAFFGALDWPPVNPQASTWAERVKTIPAKVRYDAGTP